MEKNHLTKPELTLEQLPKLVDMLYNKVEQIESMLQSRTNTSVPQEDEILTVSQVAALLNLTVPTVYSIISKRELAFIKKSKRVYVLKEDLLTYLKEGRIRTTRENLDLIDKMTNSKSNKR